MSQDYLQPTKGDFTQPTVISVDTAPGAARGRVVSINTATASRTNKSLRALLICIGWILLLANLLVMCIGAAKWLSNGMDTSLITIVASQFVRTGMLLIGTLALALDSWFYYRSKSGGSTLMVAIIIAGLSVPLVLSASKLSISFMEKTRNAMTAKSAKPIESKPVIEKHSRKLITGILYSEDKPCAVIEGRLVYEGNTVDGAKIVRILDKAVEFEKDRIRWRQEVEIPPGNPKQANSLNLSID